MAKQTKNIRFSEIFNNIDKDVSSTLEKCNNGKTVSDLKPEEREKLWVAIFNLLKENNVENLSEENLNVIKNCVELICSILIVNNLSNNIKLEVITIIKYLNSVDFLPEEQALVNSISKVNEHWMTKVQCSEDIPGMEYFTLKHLLSLCTSEKPLVADIQRLSSIRKVISANPFDKTIPSLRPLLIKLVQKPQVLSSEHGQRFLAQAFNLSPKIMMEIHRTIMLDLGSCSKKKATDYGKIYVMAWHVASIETKESLEKNCFQHLMESILKEQRTSLELNKNSQNILAVLEVWHSERKKKNPDFITMITNAYQPILWKYLQSGFNVHRCNATDVFFKAFPLQRSNDNAVEAERLFNMQFDAMLASLTDDCHIVRIIGIREVCNILSHYWNAFSPVQIQSLMSVITKQDAKDASSAEVRRMVYVGLQSLVNSPLSCDYVKQILPNLASNIHDVNQKVRISFIQLLICIKEKKDPNFKYSNVVSMSNIQYRLAEDNIAVGQWIVKLLMSNYYQSKMEVVEWMKRFIYLIKTYRASYRNFFFYSSKSLPFPDACKIIYEILSQLGVFVCSKSCVDQESDEGLAETDSNKIKESKRKPLSNWNGKKDSSKRESNVANKETKKCAFDEPEVVSGLFDIVTILWVLHDIKLNKPENEEIRFKLYDTYIKYAQPFINYYKDTSLFLGVLCLSGNIPASLLRSNSITLPGYCIKMLKSIQMDRCDEENEKILSMLVALVKWGHGGEIIDQVTLWLDAAFETQDMNETILPRRRVKISETIQPNSILAIYILDTLLKKEYLKLSILKKNYQALFHLWKFMSRIQKLIETRLDQGEPFSEDLVSDQFLILCFRRYVKLIPLLKEDSNKEEEKENQSPKEKPEIFINRQKEMENVVEWAGNLLLPLLQQEELEEEDSDLVTALLEDLLYVSDNMIIVHMVNHFFLFKTAHFALKLLDTKFGPRFIKASCRVTASLNFSAKLLFKVNDDLQIFSTVIPSLLSHTLNVLTNQDLSLKDIGKLEKDMPVIKTCFWKVLYSFQDNLKSASSLRENVRKLKLVVGLFVDSIVSIVSQQIPREDLSIPLYASPSQLPPIASSLMSLFHNKKTWTSLFIHSLNTKLAAKNFDSRDTISVILLLHLFANSDKKANQGDIRKVLTTALSALNRLKGSVDKSKEKVDDPSMETETTTKKTWPSNAATRGCSSTWTGLSLKDTDKEDNTSKKEVDQAMEEVEEASEETDENNAPAEKIENLSSFRCESGNLEADFIICGFELIKSIENVIVAQSVEAENVS